MFAAFSTLTAITALVKLTQPYHPPLAAQAGDVIVVTVFTVLRVWVRIAHPELGQNLSDAERIALIQKHQRPQPDWMFC